MSAHASSRRQVHSRHALDVVRHGAARRAFVPGVARLAALAAIGLACAAPATAAVTPAHCRFAAGVVAFSSQFGTTDWSAQRALGTPDVYPTYGDRALAWASATADDQAEFLDLSFADPAPIDFVNVYETTAPGAVAKISVKNPGTGQFQVVWTGVATPGAPFARIFTATFARTTFAVSEVRIDFDSPAVPGWNEIDAVAIGDCDMLANGQWAASVTDFSSERSPTSGSAEQALGAPDVYPAYGDNPLAWSGATPDGHVEYLLLGFDTPAPIDFLELYETNAPGALDKVSVQNPNTGDFEDVWSGVAAAAPPASRIFHVSFPETRYLVSQVRLEFNSPAVPGANEVDAVGIGRCACLASLVDVAPEPAPDAARLLEAPRPNPFRTGTELGFVLRAPGPVRLEVFTVLGQRVARLVDGALPAGRHAVRWTGVDARGRRLRAGIYLVRLEAEGQRETRTLVRVD